MKTPHKNSDQSSSVDAELPLGFYPMRLHLATTGLTIMCGQAEMYVGRHRSCEIRLPLPDVSRRHCRLSFREQTWIVFDLGSTNGIKVNGRRVAQCRLVSGDQLGIGGFNFEVEMPEGIVPEPPPPQQHERDMLQSITDTLDALKGVNSDLRRAS